MIDVAERPVLLTAADLHKTYMLGKRCLEVLRGVSLRIDHGDFIAIRGASGAGKSTLLHLLGGLDTLAQIRNQRVGFIFQAYHLLPELDALENVGLPARMARMPAAAAETRARELLRRVGLGERLEHRPSELSGGEQQRVAIARALVNQPALILADEPTGNLDSHAGAEILDLLETLRAEQGAALMIATHDARVAARAQRVLELVDGQVPNA